MAERGREGEREEAEGGGDPETATGEEIEAEVADPLSPPIGLPSVPSFFSPFPDLSLGVREWESERRLLALLVLRSSGRWGDPEEEEEEEEEEGLCVREEGIRWMRLAPDRLLSDHGPDAEADPDDLRANIGPRVGVEADGVLG